MPRERCDATYALVLMAIREDHPGVRQLVADSDMQVSDSTQFAIEVAATPDKIEFLRTQLSNHLSNRREKAAYLLCRFEAVDALADIAALMQDQNDDVLLIAMQTLAELHAIEYFSQVVQLVEHRTPFVRAIAALCCLLFGLPAAVPRLVPLLQDPDAEVRYSTVRTLGSLGAVEVVEEIALLLADPVEKVRWQAAFSLGSLGDLTALPHLRMARCDPSTDVVGAVEIAISEILRRSH